MASSRKKQDEKNLKTLREVGTLQYNKYCFDCNQRGPTYVNVTIGSFVCTKCSGMLRGLTPPHRVKSISMATFTTEEIDLLKNRGNDYCKRVWLGLYEDSPLKDSNDEQAIRDHMINKYERKRYYLDPAQALRNGYAKVEPVVKNSPVPETKPLKTLVADPKPLQVNGNMNYKDRPRKVAENKNTAEFVADFDRADIFNSANNNHINNNGFCNGMQGGFANFDNNPIFNNTNPPATSSPVVSVNNINQQKMLSVNQSPPPPPPVEDKYAALKDLDNELKSQNQENILKSNVSLDWTSQAGSNGSTYSSPTPTMYSSSSSQNSVFGSPTQGSYMNGFAQNENAPVVNPFSNGVIQWQNNNMVIGVQQTYPNPFRAMDAAVKMNGFPQPVQNGGSYAVVGNGASPWTTVNPFKVGATMGSNNPFL